MASTFEVLGEPRRREILDLLRARERPVGELVDRLALSQPAVSKHLKVLEGAGLISRGRDAQWRPCTLNAAPLRDVDAWMEDYRAHMEASLDRLGEYLRTLTTPAPPDPADEPSDR